MKAELPFFSLRSGILLGVSFHSRCSKKRYKEAYISHIASYLKKKNEMQNLNLRRYKRYGTRIANGVKSHNVMWCIDHNSQRYIHRFYFTLFIQTILYYFFKSMLFGRLFFPAVEHSHSVRLVSLLFHRYVICWMCSILY